MGENGCEDGFSNYLVKALACLTDSTKQAQRDPVPCVHTIVNFQDTSCVDIWLPIFVLITKRE